jgi:radial spoke head protein 1
MMLFLTQPYEILYEGDSEKLSEPSKDGKATASYPNGDVYEGSFAGGVKSGKGSYTWSKGGSYTGEYKANVRHGRGTMAFPDKSQYVGDWANNKMNGRGCYTYRNGDKYVGELRNSLKHGNGTYIYAENGTQYSGEWVAGECADGTWKYYSENEPFVLVAGAYSRTEKV